MNKCSCWRKEQTIKSWKLDKPIFKDREICIGTKECEECNCHGDETKCCFYPEKREKAIENRKKELKMNKKENNIKEVNLKNKNNYVQNNQTYNNDSNINNINNSPYDLTATINLNEIGSKTAEINTNINNLNSISTSTNYYINLNEEKTLNITQMYSLANATGDTYYSDGIKYNREFGFYTDDMKPCSLNNFKTMDDIFKTQWVKASKNEYTISEAEKKFNIKIVNNNLKNNNLKNNNENQNKESQDIESQDIESQDIENLNKINLKTFYDFSWF